MRSKLAPTVALAALVLAGALVAATPASAASEEKQGAAILRSIEAGKTDCGDLSSEDFDHVGEYVMLRMTGSSAAHEQMNELMKQMMGAEGERQMHVVMGKRFSGCGGGEVPNSFGGMMGMMGMMGATGGFRGNASNRGSMMDGGSMMGGWGDEDDDGWDAADTVGVVVMILVLLGLAAVAVSLVGRRTRGAGDAREILAQRYARGEMDTEEYQRRLAALRGE